jgi:hypothetical protein
MAQYSFGSHMNTQRVWYTLSNQNLPMLKGVYDTYLLHESPKLNIPKKKLLHTYIHTTHALSPKG